MTGIFAIIAPVFLCAAVGYGWARAGRPFDRVAVSHLNMDVAAPCLVFSRLVGLGADPDLLAQLAGAAALSFVAFGILGAAVLRVTGLPRHTFLSPLVFTNAGNMGLPVCLFAFGEEGLALAIAYFAVAATAQFTLGPVLWSGGFDARALARTPVVWAVLFAVGVTATDSSVPGWLLNTTQLLGDLAVPLMLLTLGVSLAELRVSSWGRSLGLAGVRLIMGFGVGVGIAELFELEGVARGVFVLQCAMPAAVFNHLFAQRYRRSPDQIASLVVASTALGFLTLPFLLDYVLGRG